MQKETLASISKQTGFSVSTISRVLNGKAQKYRIAENTVEIVMEAARQSGYMPNVAAQSLRTRRTNTIGLMVPSLENPFYANISNVIISTARSSQYTVILIDTMENEHDERNGINLLLSRNVDGIIVVPCGNDVAVLDDASSKVPVVLIDRYYHDCKLPYVSTDNYQGSYRATQMLIDNGHRRICCIQGPPSSVTSSERVRGYRKALEDNGLGEYEMVRGTEFTIRNGYTEAKLALASPEPPTAIFTMGNTILLGSMKAIEEAGMKVPQDISIVSFDNYTYLDFFSPPITRVSQPVDEMGMLAVRILLQLFNDEDPGVTQLLLPPGLIVRNSVRKI